MKWTLAILIAGGALLACDNERQEAAVVLEAIHRFRAASNDSLPAMVDALNATPCKTPEICKARDECARVGDSTAKALRLKAEVERGLIAPDGGTHAIDPLQEKAFEAKLDEASKDLVAGNEGLPRCDAAVQSLKRRYNL